MRTVICVPYRGDERRDRLWQFTLQWIQAHYPYPVFKGDSDGEFSRGAARNAAAALAGDWDVAIFHDSDTIAHPDAVEAAVKTAAEIDKMVVAGDSHMYCDRPSTDRILASNTPMFPRPVSFDEHGVYEKPCSGVVAVNRNLYNKVGGYPELTGWGYEDLVFLQACGIFGRGNTWVDGHITLHLWHEPSDRTRETQSNLEVWKKLANYRLRADRDGARRYLASIGHRVP